MSKQYIDKKKAKKAKKIVVRNRSGEVTNTVIPGGLSVGVKGENEGLTVYGESTFEGTINAERILIDGSPVESSATAGANFFFTTNILTVEATPDYANPVSGEDWSTDFVGAPSTKMDGSLSSGTRLTTPGNDYSNTSLGGDSNIDTNEYLVDGSNVTAETDNGTSLTVSLEGHNDLSPRDFRINMKRGSKTVAALRITRDSDDKSQILTLVDLAQHDDESNSNTFAKISVSIPYKLNLGSGVVDLTRVLVIQKLVGGTDGTDGADGADGAPGADGSDGSAGTDARAVHLTVSSGKNVIIYDQDGANPTPSSITISATDQNVPDGTDAKFRFLLNDSEAQGSSTTSTHTFSAPSSIDDSSLPLKFEVELREGAGSTVKATDQITIPGVRDGSDAYTVVLENEAHTIPADSSGTVIDPDGSGDLTGYENSGTKIVVYKGSTQLTGLTAGSTPSTGQYVVTSAVQQGTITVGSYTVNSDGDVVIPDHASFTSETALISYTINAEGSASITKLQSLTKSRRGIDGVDGADGSDGSDGAAGRTVKLTTTHQAIVYDAAEGNPSPDGETTGQEVTITATAINSSGTPYYRFFKDDSVVQGGSYGGTDSTYSYIPEASYSNMPDKIEVELREGNTSEDPVLARDQITIFGLKPGNDGYSVLLGNEAHTIPANADGTFESGAFAGSGTTLNVFKGTTQLKHTTTSDAGSGFYRYAVSATNISADGSPDTSSSIYEVVYGDAASAGSDSEDNDTASIEFTIYAEEGSADGATITKTQTFSKSKRGVNGSDGAAGTDGKTVKLTVSAGKQGIAYTDNGVSPDPDECTILATRFGPALSPGHTAYYRFTKDGVVQGSGFDTATSLTYTPPASFDDMPDSILVELGEGTNASNAASNVVAQDEITMFGLRPGENAYTMILTNEAHSLPALSTSPTDAVYTDSGTTVRVYKGVTELTAVTSSPSATEFTVVAEGTNIDPRGSSDASVSPTSVSSSGAVYADHSNMTQNNATITYTVTTGGSGPTLVKVQTLSKSLRGSDGDAGTSPSGVDLELDPPVVIYDSNGNNPDVSEIDLIASPRNLGTSVNVLNFDGTANARIYQASLSSSNFSFSDGSSTDNPFTVSFWLNVNSDANSSDFQRLYRSWYPFAVGYQSNDMKIALRDETNNETNTFTSAQSSGKDFLEDEEGNWVHVVLAYTPETSNGANNEKIDFYKNGSLWSTHVSPNDSYDHGGLTDNQSYVGWYNATNAPDMKLSSLLHYNHDGSSGRGSSAFTASDAAAIYNSGFVHTDYTSLTKGDDIVGYWKLDDDPTSGEIKDYSGSDEDFTTISSGVTRDTSSGLKSRGGPVYFTFKVAGTTIGSADQTLPYATWSSIPATFNSFVSSPKTATVEIKINNSSDPADSTDQAAITAINPGSNAPVVVLDNPIHIFSGDADGEVSDYTNSGTEIQVYSNGVLLSGLTSTGSAPTTDSGTFQVISRTVTPANRVVLDALADYTVGTGDDHGDRIIVPDHTQASADVNQFSKTVGQSAKVTYQINVEGTTIAAVQTLNVNSPGNRGEQGLQGLQGLTGETGERGLQGLTGANGLPGADVGIEVELYEPLVVVGTDTFGKPLTGQLDLTATSIYVRQNGTALHYDTSVSVGDSTNPGEDKWTVIENTTIESAHGTDDVNWAGPTGDLFTIHDDNPDYVEWAAITSMGAEGIFRSLTVKVNIGGTIYYPIVTQQVTKAIQENNELEFGLVSPYRHYARNEWDTYYWPKISDDQITSMGLYVTRIDDGSRRGINHSGFDKTDETLTIGEYIFTNRDDQRHFSGLVMPDTTYSASDSEGSFGQQVTNNDQGHNSYVGLKYPDNSNSTRVKTMLPVNGFVESTIKYKDSVGNIQYGVVRMGTVATVQFPPTKTFEFMIYIDFDDTAASSAFKNLRISGNSIATSRLFVPQRKTASIMSEPERFGYVDRPGTQSSRGDIGDNWRYAGDGRERCHSSVSADRLSQITFLDSDQEIEDAIVASLGTTARLTGRAWGQINYRSLGHATSNKDTSLGIDLYTVNALSSNHSANRPSSYLGSLVFSNYQNDSTSDASTFVDLDSSGHRGIQGIVKCDNSSAAIPDMTGAVGAVNAPGSTNIMKASKTRAIHPVIAFKRDSSSDLIPNDGYCFIHCVVEYYDLDWDQGIVGRSP